MSFYEDYQGVIAVAIVSMVIISGSAVVFATTSVSQQSSGKLTVVASFYPIYYFTSQIGGDRIDLILLIPDNSDPHAWEPKASDALKVSNADVFIYNGGGLEPWLDSFLPNLPSDAVIVDSSIYVNQSGQDDPHFWMDPISAMAQVDSIAEGLEKADPGNATYYAENAANLKERLQQLNEAYNTGLANRTTDVFITTHEGFNYLAARYGLTDLAAVGISADAQPSAADLANLESDVKEYGLKYVFSEPIYNDAVVQMIAEETGCKVLVLDAIHGRTGVHAHMDYFEIMYANLAALEIGLGVN